MRSMKYSASFKLALLALFFGLLQGCASLSGERPAEQATSQQRATSDSQQRAKIHTELGSLYLQRGNVAVALEEARIALSADGNYAPAHNLMGLAYMQLRENGPAERSFDQALSLAPNDPEINNNFGWFLCQTSREQRALTYFNAAIKSPLYTTPVMPNINAGICLLRIKDDKGAEDYFMRALRLDPGNVRAMLFLTDIAYRQGRIAAAGQQLSELHRLAEPNAESLWLAVCIEKKLGNRQAEASYTAQLRDKFAGSPEHSKLLQGQCE